MWDIQVEIFERLQAHSWEDPLEEELATHASVLAWRIPWAGGLQSMGSQRVGHDSRNLAQPTRLKPLRTAGCPGSMELNVLAVGGD